MKIRLRVIWNIIEWAFDYLVDRLGIRRRHVVFGLMVLFLCALFTTWYIYEKNWVITGTKRTGGQQRVLTLALNGEESAVQQMSQEIRASILETPMAAASAQPAAQSASGANAERSAPQEAAAQSATAASASAPELVQAAGANANFKPTVSNAAARMESGQARSETSQVMRAANPNASARQAAGRNARRSTPQATTAQSATAATTDAPNAVSAAGADSALAPTVSVNTAQVASGSARAETSQQMSSATARSNAQSALGNSAARSNPSDTSPQSATASSSAAPSVVNPTGASAAFRPSRATSSAERAAVSSRGARADDTSQKMASASSQALSQSASGRNSARSNPQSAPTQTAAAANSASDPGSASASGTSATFSPSTSGTRATASAVRSNGARAETGQSMSGASSQAMAQASTSAQGTARNSPGGSISRPNASASARSESAAVSGSGASGSFSPSVSGSRASVSGVRSNGARAEAGRAMSGASFRSMASAANAASGSARNSPAGTSSQSTGSASASNTAAAVSGSGSSGSFSPSVSGARASVSAVRSNAARAESGRSMSGADSRNLARASNIANGSARNSPAGSTGRAAGSARASSPSASVAGSGAQAAMAPSVSGLRASVSGVRSGVARAEAGRAMSGVNSQNLARASNIARGAARNSPAGSTGRAAGSARASSPSASVAGSGAQGALTPSFNSQRSVLTGVRQGTARSEVGREIPVTPSQTFAQATARGVGPARVSPAGLSGRVIGSASANRDTAPIAGRGVSGSIAPSVSGARGVAARVVRDLPRLGGTTVDTNQAMVQVTSQSMARPVRLATARSRPGMSLPPLTASSATPSEAAVINRDRPSSKFTPTARSVTIVPTLDEVRPKPPVVVAAKNSPPVEVRPPRARPVVDSATSVDPVVKDDLSDPFTRRRNPDARNIRIGQLGGSRETESAVLRALEWLKRNQASNGSWNWREHDSAATGLAMLAFMGYGAKHLKQGGYEGYQEQMSRAVKWMLSIERDGDMRAGGNMYDHGIAAIAMAEAYYLTKDPALRPVVQRIVDFTAKAQNPATGGWRYKPYLEKKMSRDGSRFGPLDFDSRKRYVSPGDMSVTGWQIMALKSAQVGGLNVPAKVFDRALKFMDGRRGAEGSFGYIWKGSATPALAAQGLFSLQMLREHTIAKGHSTPGQVELRNKQTAEYLGRHIPEHAQVATQMRSARNDVYSYYYWYYASLALYQQQGAIWNQWNARMTPILLQRQVSGGPDDGSWAPAGKWGSESGRAVTTALAALSLEVYYRYLPPTLTQAGSK